MNNLHAHRSDIEPGQYPGVNGLNPIDTISDDVITNTIRIEVYKGDKYIGKKIFSQNRIVIGKSMEADLVLSDDVMADQHACITLIDGQLVIIDQTMKAGLLVKGALCGISILESPEQIGIGPYLLKISHHKDIIDQSANQPQINEDGIKKEIRISFNNSATSALRNTQTELSEHMQKETDRSKKDETPEVDLFALFEGSPVTKHELYDLVFEGDIREGLDIKNVRANLSKILKVEESRIEHFFTGKRVVLKSAQEIETAEKYKKYIEKSGAVCTLKVHRSSKSPAPGREDLVEKSSSTTKKDTFSAKGTEIVTTAKEYEHEEKVKKSISLQSEEKAAWKFYGVDVDEEDEEEEDLPADFFLKDRINELNESSLRQGSVNGRYLEIIKYYGNVITDIRYLEENEKFYILNDMDKRFCLAEFKTENEALFYFDEKLHGDLEHEGRPVVETRLLMKDENLVSKRKKIYCMPVPGKGNVVISDGYFKYQIRLVSRSFIPQAPEIKTSHKKSYRHLGVSFAFHVVFLLFLGLFPSFQNTNKPVEETRFVQLDTNQLTELEKVVNPQLKPEPKPPEPPPVVKPTVEKMAEQKVSKNEPVKTASAKKPSEVKTGGGGISRHPDAGGGFGEGNVETRNINETGILGIISDTVGIQPRNALAAVTNLDAVSSPNVTANNFRVGGVVGKLGTGEIAVPKASSVIVATKGSRQVLRSHGAKGEGRVAALEKGKTGEREVMGMVSATPDKSVRINGGLSMEAVKQVIDQHLDEITYCYECELISNPSIVGKVMFEWKIMMSGEVGEVRIKSSSINSHEVHNCIKNSIRTWQFPKPRGAEVMVSYPFIFDIVGF